MGKPNEIEIAISEALPLLFQGASENQKIKIEKKYTQSYELFVEDSSMPISTSTINYQQLLIRSSIVFFIILLYHSGSLNILGISVQISQPVLVGYAAFLLLLAMVFLSKVFIDGQRRAIIQTRRSAALQALGVQMLNDSIKRLVQHYYWEKIDIAISKACHEDEAYVAALTSVGFPPSIWRRKFESGLILDTYKSLPSFKGEQERVHAFYLDIEQELLEHKKILHQHIESIMSEEHVPIPAPGSPDGSKAKLLRQSLDDVFSKWRDTQENLSKCLNEVSGSSSDEFPAHEVSAGIDTMLRKATIIRKLHFVLELIMPLFLLSSVFIYWRVAH
ncbi:hypothetical protein ACI2KS_11680 [Pseudomonas sp. NPDC087358]|uniref:hypothetical protein n=1 Tax=Pseudomonas sp. NPDC087358 TaxID=3364439 RepID=UPI003850067D